MKGQICPLFPAANRASVARNIVAFVEIFCVMAGKLPLQLTQM
jgi:hypothetical protein